MPTTLRKADRSRAYSLLQSAIALTIMAIGILLLVPRLNTIIEEAWRAHVKSVATSLKTGAMIYREAWITDPQSTLLTGMAMNDDGWPVGTVKENGSGVMSTARCEGLWNRLLDKEVPTLSVRRNTGADFRVEVVEERCRYYHTASGDRFFIDYDTAHGRVSWNIR